MCAASHFQVFGALDALCRHIGRPKGLRDDDFRIFQLFVQYAARAILAGRDHVGVAVGFEVFAQAQLARDAAQQRAGREVNRLGGGQGLPVLLLLGPMDGILKKPLRERPSVWTDGENASNSLFQCCNRTKPSIVDTTQKTCRHAAGFFWQGFDLTAQVETCSAARQNRGKTCR